MGLPNGTIGGNSSKLAGDGSLRTECQVIWNFDEHCVSLELYCSRSLAHLDCNSVYGLFLLFIFLLHQELWMCSHVAFGPKLLLSLLLGNWTLGSQAGQVYPPIPHFGNAECDKARQLELPIYNNPVSLIESHHFGSFYGFVSLRLPYCPRKWDCRSEAWRGVSLPG